VRRKFLVALKIIASFPIAYFGGNLAFGILASGSWLTAVLALILNPSVAMVVFAAVLWLIRFVVLVFLLVAWVPSGYARNDIGREVKSRPTNQ
jgi:hypothetical protein